MRNDACTCAVWLMHTRVLWSLRMNRQRLSSRLYVLGSLMMAAHFQCFWITRGLLKDQCTANIPKQLQTKSCVDQTICTTMQYPNHRKTDIVALVQDKTLIRTKHQT